NRWFATEQEVVRVVRMEGQRFLRCVGRACNGEDKNWKNMFHGKAFVGSGYRFTCYGACLVPRGVAPWPPLVYGLATPLSNASASGGNNAELGPLLLGDRPVGADSLRRRDRR